MTPKAKKNIDGLLLFISNWKTISGFFVSCLLFIGSTANGYIKSVTEPIIDSAMIEQKELYQLIIQDQDEQHKKYLARSFARLEMSQSGCNEKKNGMKGVRKCQQLEDKIADEYLTMMEGDKNGRKRRASSK